MSLLSLLPSINVFLNWMAESKRFATLHNVADVTMLTIKL